MASGGQRYTVCGRLYRRVRFLVTVVSLPASSSSALSNRPSSGSRHDVWVGETAAESPHVVAMDFSPSGARAAFALSSKEVILYDAKVDEAADGPLTELFRVYV